MRRGGLALLTVLGLVAGSGAALHAQVFTPSFQAPRAGGDVGAYLSEGPGSFALEGIWRRNLGAYETGFRAGIADMEDAALLVGAELRNPFTINEAPVALAFTGGVQAVVSERTGAGFIAGVSIGHTEVAGDITVTGYVHPRLGLVQGLRRADELTARVLADIGLDIEFQPNLALRIGFGLGRNTADWGIGFAWR